MITTKIVFKFYCCLHLVTPFAFTVGVKHPKNYSNLSKSIEQSNIITQELETIEKANIFDVN